MNFLRFSLSLTVLFFATGCATSVNVNLPTTRFDSPETLGTGGDFELGAMVFGATKVQLIDNAASRPPVEGNTRYGQSLAVAANGYLGLAERLDIRFNLGLAGDEGLSSLPLTIGFKFQAIGDPRATAKKGNFSLALAAGIGFGTNTDDGDQKVIFGPGGFPWEAKTTTLMYELGLIIGTRISDKVVMYGASYYTTYNINVDLHHGAADDASSGAADYEYDFDGKMLSGHFGIIFTPGSVYSLAFEGAYLDEKFEGKNGHGELFAGVQNRFNF